MLDLGVTEIHAQRFDTLLEIDAGEKQATKELEMAVGRRAGNYNS